MADARAEQGSEVLRCGHCGSLNQREEQLSDLNAMLEPGMLVRHPAEPDWGLGQVQSNVGGRVTVNFEHRGKVVFYGDHVVLQMVFD